MSPLRRLLARKQSLISDDEPQIQELIDAGRECDDPPGPGRAFYHRITHIPPVHDTREYRYED